MSPGLIVCGFVVGAIVGLTGVGAAAIMTPLLVLAFRVNPLIAVGSDLAYSVPTRLVAAYLHAQQRTVNWRVTSALLLGGVPAALMGLALLYWLRAHVAVSVINVWTRHAIGVALFIAAVVMLVRAQGGAQRPAEQGRALARKDAGQPLIVVIGAIVGLIVTITSIGSGSVTLPLLVIALPAAALPELVGSDIAFGALLIPAAAFGHWTMGDVSWPLVANLLVGSLPGVYLGSKFCARIQARWLRPAVALTLAVVGAGMV